MPVNEAAYRLPVVQWSDTTLRGQVCHARDDGGGPVICGKGCENYIGCEVGHEWVRRGLTDNRVYRQKRKARQNVNENAKALIREMDRLRREAGMTRGELAKACGASVCSIDNWAGLHSMPSIDKFCAAMKALGKKVVIVEAEKDGTV